MQLIQFLLLAGVTLLLIIFFASGAIGYFFHSLSNNPAPNISPATLPRWEELPKFSRELVIPAIAIIAAVWVLVGESPSAKVEQKKGRNKKRFDED